MIFRLKEDIRKDTFVPDQIIVEKLPDVTFRIAAEAAHENEPRLAV